MENNIPPDQNDLNKNNNGPQQNPNFNQPNPNPYFQGNNPQQQIHPGGGYYPVLPPVPGATTGLVLGIIGLFFSVICLYWVAAFIGLVCCIIALVTSNRATRQYLESPGMFSDASYGNAKAGRVLGIIGLIVSILWFLFLFIIIFTAASFANSFRF